MAVNMLYTGNSHKRYTIPAVSRSSIVLLHGWGCDHRVWEPLLPLFSTDDKSLNKNVILVDIQYGNNDIDQFIDHLSEQLPPQSILCGWSLGGMLATRLAARHPKKINGLITLATNAAFYAREHWAQAMPATTFHTFCKQFNDNNESGLKRFVTLQALGDSQARQQKLWLQQQLNASSGTADTLQCGLNWLEQIDNTGLLASLTMPALHLFGENDALVPQQAAAAIQQHCGSQHTTCVLPRKGHLLHYPIEHIAPHITSFLKKLNAND